MNLRKVLFVGGDPLRNASVQMRAVEIAEKLGCDCARLARTAREIPDRYSVFVCVKPRLRPGELAELSKRGVVVWDIIDELPPRENVALYLTSTRFAQKLFRGHGRVEMIPHRHCNFSGEPNPAGNRRPGWIGHKHWYPEIPGVEHDTYFVDRMSTAEVAQAHRRIGIGLNLRRPGPKHDFHAALNSGVKLINCLSFGVPSVSNEEPAYEEFGEGCTLFSTPKQCAKWVRALQNDDDLYNELRQRCLRRAPKFHIDSIADKYRKLLASL